MTKRLLLVAADDSPLRALVHQFADRMQLHVFSSPNEALWEVRLNPPEVLLAECDLAEMSGLELLEIALCFEDAPRVLLYSSSPDSLCATAETIGAFRFLQGALDSEQLFAVVSQAANAAPSPRGVDSSLLLPATPAAPSEPPPLASAVQAAPDYSRQATVDPPSPPAAPSPSTEPSAQSSALPADQPPPRRDFTPARVVLPTMREREAAAAAAAAAAAVAAAQPPVLSTPSAPASSRPRGLAARSRAAAARMPEPSRSPLPPAEPPSVAWRASEGNLVVTEHNINAIRTVMSHVAQDLGTQSIILTDRAGMPLVEVGSSYQLPMMVVLPLLSTGFSTTGEVARQLGEEHGTSVYIHEGVKIDLYCFDVMQRFLLVLVFNKQVAHSKLGAIWINTKRAIRELDEILQH
ncbi:response regulator [Candidatus Chloroploca sp. M-50]|uniref:Response regulator n=1 Tax=Candidatus Chloroploca mongolica TaxID=2528176 RepID=A0ABS4D585_9CHLR|nr:response regulator [Candidatus Chloroploca mongolica]MBP1464596.1 response regulator [Candidatus Chloroploca mongolica]